MHLGTLKKSNECPVCEGAMSTLIDLPKFPMTEFYEERSGEFVDKGYVDQEFLYCVRCSHGKLGTVIDPGVLYQHNYRTATAKSIGAAGAVSNFAAFVKRNCPENQYECVVDIGGNDGSLLNQFPAKHSIAIDPNASGDAELVNKFIEDVDLSHLKSVDKLILCSHTLEHIEKPESIFGKLRQIVMVNDYCAFQFPSLDYLVLDCRIDQIHHQHIHYYSLRSISLIMARYGFEIVAHEFDTSHYGTLMIVFRMGLEELKGQMIPPSNIERANALFNAEATALNNRLGWHVGLIGYGASLMLPVLKYYLPNLSQLEYVVDEDDSKVGKRYINMDVEIRKFEVMGGKDVVVTAFNTKRAVRRIVEKLFAANAANVIVPFHCL